MSLTGELIPRTYISVLLLCLWVGQAKHIQLCTFQNDAYHCHTANRHLQQKLALPPNACLFKDCSNCVRSKQTYILSENFQLIKPERFVLDSDNTLDAGKTSGGSSTFFRCGNDTESFLDTKTCNCHEGMCQGSRRFCEIFPCANLTTKCFCELLNFTPKLTHISSEGQTLINPQQINFDICLFDKTASYHQRQLLEFEAATFKNNNLTVSFVDPLITLEEEGKLILRTQDYEYILDITSDHLLVTVPFELLAHETELSIIFVNNKGLAVFGKVKIAGKDVCRLTQCILCRHVLKTVQCWSPFWKYCAYVVAAILGLTALCLVKFLLSFFISIYKLLALGVILVFRLLRALARVSLLTGNYIGINIQHVSDSAMAVLEAQRPQAPANAKYLIIALLCAAGLNSADAHCSDASIVSSELKLCEIHTSDTKTCKLSTVAELTLRGLQSETCLLLQDKDKAHVVSLKLKLNSVECEFKTQREYFTFPVEANYLSQTSCYFSARCGRGDHCVISKMNFEGLRFEAETHASRSYMGLSGCIPGGLGSGCFFYTRSACNFYRVYYVPDLLKSFEVSKITGYTCRYNIEIAHLENSSLTQISVHDVAYTKSGIEVSVLGAFDQNQLILQENLVLRVGNNQEGYLMHTAPRNAPHPGIIGAVQANESYTKNFIFNPEMAKCSFFETTLRCEQGPDPVLQMLQDKESALPITRDLHLMNIQNGKLSSTLLSTSAIKIQLRFSNFKLEVQTRIICPKFSSTEMKISGCYKCKHFAHLTFHALSTCQPGIVSVEFQEITTYTKAIKLEMEETTIIVKFLGEQKCYKEKICLRSQTLIQCQTLDFCLTEPSIQLQDLNTNYTTTEGKSASFQFSDWISFPSLGNAFFIFKFLGAALVCICLFITLFSTCVSCCGRK